MINTLDTHMSENDDQASQTQSEALQLGRLAEAQGLTVIYIHGRPYADPAHEGDPEDRTKSSRKNQQHGHRARPTQDHLR